MVHLNVMDTFIVFQLILISMFCQEVKVVSLVSACNLDIATIVSL